MFIRTLGSAVGIALFGGIANAILADRFSHPPEALVGRLPDAVDAASISFTRRHQAADVVAYTRSALFDAVHWVFWALVAVAVLGLVAQLLMPHRAEPLRLPDEAAESGARRPATHPHPQGGVEPRSPEASIRPDL